MSPKSQTGRTIRIFTGAAAAATMLVGVLIHNPSAMAATTAVEGAPCETLGQRAEGTSLDCVTTPEGQTWRTKGTRLNPFRVGETATIMRYVGAKWVVSYTVMVTSGNPDASADVTIGKSATSQKAIPAGWRPVSAGVVIKLIGTKPAPSAGLQSDFVDSANKAFPLFAYRKGEIDCNGPYAKQVNEAKLTQNNGTILGNVCTFVEPASITNSLLMRMAPKAIKKGEPRETWFAFLP
jgi:hypothetical protein